MSGSTGGAMASSNKRERKLAREKHERQEARRRQEDKKADRTKIVAWVLIISLVLLTTGGVLLNWLFFN
jgi:flagellar basal body-associated protein FliL